LTTFLVVRRPENTDRIYTFNHTHPSNLPAQQKRLQKFDSSSACGVHLQISPVNYAPRIFSPPWGTSAPRGYAMSKVMQRILKYVDTLNTSLTPDKELKLWM